MPELPIIMSGNSKGDVKMELRSQKLRKIAPELDPLRLGSGWKPEDLSKPQIIIESSFGDSHPGSIHLLELAEEARRGVAEAGGYGARQRSLCADVRQFRSMQSPKYSDSFYSFF